MDMQITNSIVCDTSKGMLYKEIKPRLVGEHAFPLRGFVCKSVHVTFLWQQPDNVNCQSGVGLPM